jgi:hypothetical protein
MALRIGSQVAWRDIDGQVFVIDLRGKKLYGLSPVGGQVWRELVQKEELPAIASRLGLGSSAGAEGLAAFIAELEGHGLVTGEGEHTAPIAVSDDPARTFPNVLPPHVDWVEPLNTFGASCAFRAGQTPACTAAPTT